MDLLEYLVVFSCSPKQGRNKKPARNYPPMDPSKTGNQQLLTRFNQRLFFGGLTIGTGSVGSPTLLSPFLGETCQVLRETCHTRAKSSRKKRGMIGRLATNGPKTKSASAALASGVLWHTTVKQEVRYKKLRALQASRKSVLHYHVQAFEPCGQGAKSSASIRRLWPAPGSWWSAAGWAAQSRSASWGLGEG
jgi:hypothetical protein